MLKKSIDILNKNFGLILLLVIISLASRRTFLILGFDSKSLLFPLLLMILSILSMIMICGVLAAVWQYSVESKYNFIKGIKENFGRYFVATIISGLIWLLSSMVVINLFKGSSLFAEFIQTPGGQLLFSITGIFFGPLFVFISPYVFVKGESAKAVPDGIKYIFKNYKKSTLAIGIAFCASMVWFPSSLLDKTALASIPKIILLFISSIITWYLILLSFLVASFILDSESV